MNPFSKGWLVCMAGMLSFTFGCGAADPAEGVVRVACVGDSITYGEGIWRRERRSYPGQLQAMLGAGYAVGNFGRSGATLLKQGDLPYWETREFRDATEFEPDVVIIHLGTNDAMRFADRLEQAFERDFLALVDHFAALPSAPRILVCKPVPIFFPPADRAMSEGVVPIVARVAAARGLEVIDLHGAMREDAALFPDAVHPSEAGAERIAEGVHAALSQAAARER